MLKALLQAATYYFSSQTSGQHLITGFAAI